MSPDDEFSFTYLDSTVHGIRFLCKKNVLVTENIIAFIRGIKVASYFLDDDIRTGDIIEYAINYFPFVKLPAEVVFYGELSQTQIFPPFVFDTEDQVLNLVGGGQNFVEHINIDEGVLSGVVKNLVNCLTVPKLNCRLNGTIIRSMVMNDAIGLESGGVARNFKVYLQSSDLRIDGILIDILQEGIPEPIESLQFMRSSADFGETVARVGEELRQLRQFTADRTKVLESEFEFKIKSIERKIDVFIEYMTAAFHDSGASMQNNIGESKKLISNIFDKIDGIFRIDSDYLKELGGDSIKICPSTRFYHSGWSALHKSETANFRWLLGNGILINPDRIRAISSVEVLIFVSEPLLRLNFSASFDDRFANVNVVSTDSPNIRKVIITPIEDEANHQCLFISLEQIPKDVEATSGSNRNRHSRVAVVYFILVYQAGVCNTCPPPGCPDAPTLESMGP